MGEPVKKVSSGAPVRPVLRFLRRRTDEPPTADEPPKRSDYSAIDHLEHAQFDSAFALALDQDPPLRLLNGAGFADSFIDGDLNAFVVELSDPSRSTAPYLLVEWFTGGKGPELEPGSNNVDPGGLLPLFAIEPGVFLSRPLILVNDEDDCDSSLHPNGGLPPSHPQYAQFGGPRSKGQANFRIRRVGMKQWVHVVYHDPSSRPIHLAIDMYGAANQRVFMVQVYVLRAATAGAPLAGRDKMQELLDFALQCYERLGVWMATHVTDADKLAKGAELAQAGSSAKVLFSYLVIDPPDGADPEKMGLDGMIKLANAYPASDNRIPRVFVIKGIRAEEFIESSRNVPMRDAEILSLNKNLAGLTFDAMNVRRAGLPTILENTSWVEVDGLPPKKQVDSPGAGRLTMQQSKDAQTFAHELGHVLMNKEAWMAARSTNRGPTSGFGLGHFVQPTLTLDASGTPMNPAPPGHRLLRQANLMHVLSHPHGVLGAKRIWRAPDEHGYSWGNALASSPMLR